MEFVYTGGALCYSFILDMWKNCQSQVKSNDLISMFSAKQDQQANRVSNDNCDDCEDLMAL